ncbi:hypothetical protein ACIRRA_43115 [Nocardia sp. NPDC101769]|uniref:hypothetical protein n=1 Tax=Nocardia sp. NPDC101769 TaxID=3364333 RepID=UPI0037FD9BD1
MDADPAGVLLDRAVPRSLAGLSVDLVVAIDCDVPGARRWDLAALRPREQARDE